MNTNGLYLLAWLLMAGMGGLIGWARGRFWEGLFLGGSLGALGWFIVPQLDDMSSWRRRFIFTLALGILVAGAAFRGGYLHKVMARLQEQPSKRAQVATTRMAPVAVAPRVMPPRKPTAEEERRRILERYGAPQK